MQSFHPFRSDTSFICSLIQLYTASIHLFNWITRYFTCVFLFGLVYIFPMFWWFRFFSSLSPSDFACFIADMQVAITINVIHAAHITHIKQRMHSNETHQKPFNQPKLTEYLMHFVFTICILNSLSLSFTLWNVFLYVSLSSHSHLRPLPSLGHSREFCYLSFHRCRSYLYSSIERTFFHMHFVMATNTVDMANWIWLAL